jgi:hypothetical protein
MWHACGNLIGDIEAVTEQADLGSVGWVNAMPDCPAPRPATTSQSVTIFRVDPEFGVPQPQGEPMAEASPTRLLRWTSMPMI